MPEPSPQQSQTAVIRTPDQRLRVFISSTLAELAPERTAARRAIERLRLAPVMFELGARPHPPRALYRAYLEQSHVFVGIYWQSYGWVAPGEDVSGLEDEYLLLGDRPKLIYVKAPAPDRQPRLKELLARIRDDDRVSYKSFASPAELRRLAEGDLALLLMERFQATGGADLPAAPRVEPESTPVALSVQPTPFVGREREVADVLEMLGRPEVRLLTLTGPGGIGKSRLAVEAASRMADMFPDGVCWIPLAPVVESDLVAPAVAQVLGVTEAPGEPVAESIVRALREKRLLLVLDNFEQVVDAAPLVADWLASAADLKVLVTSRAVLRLSGEHTYPVRPLELPAADRAMSAERLSQYEAVRFFIERARAVKPGFQVTNENAPAVAEICSRLDGLPLAIELAAARVRLLPPQALLARLGSALALLTGGARDLPQRQRTLRAAIDWSYELLDSGEQLLFERLGVFVGSRTLEAVENVCNPDGALDVLDGVASLLDKSLLRNDEASGGEPHLVMLETLREYALERLAARGELDAVRARHAEHYLALAETAEPELRGSEQAAWFDRLETEHGNLRAALAWALERADGCETALRLCAALGWFWYTHSHFTEGSRWLEAALTRPCEGFALLRARVLHICGILLGEQGEYERGTAMLREAIEVFRGAGEDQRAAMSLNSLGVIAQSEGDLDRAVACFEESLEVRRKSGEPRGIVTVLNNLGIVALDRGDPARARELFEETLALDRAAGNGWGVAVALNNLGGVALEDGDLARARALFEESLRSLHALGDTGTAVECLEGLAGVAAGEGRWEDAAHLSGKAHALRENLGMPLDEREEARLERHLSAARARASQGEWDAEWRDGHAMTLDQAVEYALGAGR